MNPYQSGPGGPPQIRFERSSCFPKVLLFLVLALGGGFYFFNEKITEYFNKIPNFGSSSQSRTTQTSSSSSSSSSASNTTTDDDKEPVSAPESTLEIMYDDPQIAEDSTGDEIPEVLVHTWGPSRTGEFVTLLSGKDGAVVWSVPEPQATDFFAVRGDLVLGWKDDQLTALNLSDGGLRWSVKLIDKIHTYPTPHLWNIDSKLIIVTVDNTLTILDAKLGEQLQQRTLEATSPNRFYLLGDSLCNTERIQNDTVNADAIRCYNTTTLEDGPTIALADTWSDSANWVPDPTTDDGSGYRYLSSSSPPRLERFNPDGSLAWAQALPEDQFYTIIPGLEAMVFDKDRVAIVENPNLAIVTPEQVFALEVPEMNMMPLGFSGDILYVGEVRQRGTSKISVTAYNTTNGEKLWTAGDLGVVQSIGLDSTADWVIQPHAGLVITSYGNDNDTEYVQLIKPDGTEGWKIGSSAFIARKPLVDAVGKNVLVSFSESVKLLDAETGKEIWSHKRP